MEILPPSRVVFRVNARKTVDLPAPDAPMTARRSPGFASKETPSSAGVLPKRTLTSSRASPPSGLPSLGCEEAKFPRPLFDVVVVFGFDPLVALGTQEVEECRVFYVEEGLPQTRVLLWVAGEQLRAVFDHVVLAEYRCRYDWRERHVHDIRDGVFYPTRFASQQGRLLPLTPQDSLVVYRAKSPQRRKPHVAPSPQLLLFEVVIAR